MDTLSYCCDRFLAMADSAKDSTNTVPVFTQPPKRVYTAKEIDAAHDLVQLRLLGQKPRQRVKKALRRQENHQIKRIENMSMEDFNFSAGVHDGDDNEGTNWSKEATAESMEDERFDEANVDDNDDVIMMADGDNWKRASMTKRTTLDAGLTTTS
jgi:hypothetical protein